VFKLKTKLYFLFFVAMLFFPQRGFFMEEEYYSDSRPEPSWSRLNYYRSLSVEELEDLQNKLKSELGMLEMVLREKKHQEKN